jgi:UDP-N-acetyl-2-amino-2-deoxyglucuronate dehydrogenase
MDRPKRFALIGAAGYIAPRHMKAIKDTGNVLVAALDKHDNVGILDSYFPDCDFFTEFERFDRHLDKLRRKGEGVDYVSICSPNYLHDSHIRFALRQGADAICEKPLVLNPWNVDALIELENETSKRVYSILQLRLHPAIMELRDRVLGGPTGKKYDIQLSYITSRGRWYHHSWKGDVSKSGGIATNIGIHFFDMLLWIFGPVKQSSVHVITNEQASGELLLQNAVVTWALSIDGNDLPSTVRNEGKSAFRSLKVDGIEINFTDGFSDLHAKSYSAILANNGFGLRDSQSAIYLAHSIRASHF